MPELARKGKELAGASETVAEFAHLWQRGELVAPSSGDCRGDGWSIFPVPRLWSDTGVTSPIGGRGVATYRLRLELPTGGERRLREGPPGRMRPEGRELVSCSLPAAVLSKRGSRTEVPPELATRGPSSATRAR